MHQDVEGGGKKGQLYTLIFFPPPKNIKIFFLRQSRRKLDSCALHEEEKMSLHKVSDPGTGKRVFIQYVPYTGPEVRSSQSP